MKKIRNGKFRKCKKYTAVLALTICMTMLTGCSFDELINNFGKNSEVAVEENTENKEDENAGNTAIDNSDETADDAVGETNEDSTVGEKASAIEDGSATEDASVTEDASADEDVSAAETAATEEYFVTVGNEETGNTIEVGSNQYVADISGIKITDLDAFKAQIKQLPNLLYIDMCNCGLTNEQMEDLMNTFPSVRFVWMLHMSAKNELRTLYWNVRTDALAFSTLHAWATDPRLDNDDAQQLKYCTDLVAMDFGHNAIYDTSFMDDMNIHILITVDSYNRVEHHKFNDISVISNFPNLMYLEIFVGLVKDTSPIADCKELRDLNISYNPISSIDDLTDLPHLERLTIESTGISYEDYKKLCEIYPDAKISYYGSGSVDNGWRGHKRYFAMIDMFRNNYWNDYFRTEEELADVATYDMLIVDDDRYYGTPYTCDYDPSLGFSGAIMTTVGENNIPAENRECNFDAVGTPYKIIKDGQILIVKESDGKYHYFYRNEVLARLLCEKLDEDGVIKPEYTAKGVAAKIAYEEAEAEEAEYNEAIWEAQQAANALDADDEADVANEADTTNAPDSANASDEAGSTVDSSDSSDKAGVAEDNSSAVSVEN